MIRMDDKVTHEDFVERFEQPSLVDFGFLQPGHVTDVFRDTEPMESSQPKILGSSDADFTMESVLTNSFSSSTLSECGKVAVNISKGRFWLTINAITVELMKR
jgi:hypothetical protein